MICPSLAPRSQIPGSKCRTGDAQCFYHDVRMEEAVKKLMFATENTENVSSLLREYRKADPQVRWMFQCSNTLGSDSGFKWSYPDLIQAKLHRSKEIAACKQRMGCSSQVVSLKEGDIVAHGDVAQLVALAEAEGIDARVVVLGREHFASAALSRVSLQDTIDMRLRRARDMECVLAGQLHGLDRAFLHILKLEHMVRDTAATATALARFLKVDAAPLATEFANRSRPSTKTLDQALLLHAEAMRIPWCMIPEGLSSKQLST